MNKQVSKIKQMPVQQKEINPPANEKVVLLSHKTRARLDELQNGLEGELAKLRQQMQDLQADFVSRMTDLVSGFLDGSGVPFDLKVDTISRSQDGASLTIVYQSAPPVDQPVKAEPAPEAPEQK